MFSYRFKQIVLILTIGIGLGILVPVLMQKFSFTGPRENNVLMDDVHAVNGENLTQTMNYFARIQDGSLSIFQGDPQSGQVLLSGVDVSHWPKEMQSMVTRIEFRSLDEVQSFIDSMSEDLWLE